LVAGLPLTLGFDSQFVVGLQSLCNVDGKELAALEATNWLTVERDFARNNDAVDF
jgi:hypothetical protein